jgi:hypothetical protein
MMPASRDKRLLMGPRWHTLRLTVGEILAKSRLACGQVRWRQRPQVDLPQRRLREDGYGVVDLGGEGVWEGVGLDAAVGRA